MWRYILNVAAKTKVSFWLNNFLFVLFVPFSLKMTHPQPCDCTTKQPSNCAALVLLAQWWNVSLTEPFSGVLKLVVLNGGLLT